MTRILIAALAALAVAGSAFAQPAPWAPERTTAGWTFTPGIAIGTLRDTNVTLVNEGNPKQDEWVGRVNPRGELQYNGRHTRFNVGYSGALEAYRTLDALNRYEQRSRASLRRQFSERLQLDASASYAVSPTTDRLELGTLPFVDIGSRTFDAGGVMRYAVSPRSTFDAEYRFQRVRFDQNTESVTFLNGGHAHSPAVRFTRSFTTRLGIGGEWQYRHATLQGVDDAFGVHNVLGTVSYQAGPSTTLTGALGTSSMQILSTDQSEWGPAFRAGVEHQVQRVSVYARYFRSFVPSFSFGGLTGNQQFSAGVRAPLSQAGRLAASGSTTFSRTSPVEELGLGYQSDSLAIHGAIEYQFAPWLRTEGFVTSTHHTSTARGNVDRLRIGIQFITSKPVRIE